MRSEKDGIGLLAKLEYITLRAAKIAIIAFIILYEGIGKIKSESCCSVLLYRIGFNGISSENNRFGII